MADVGKVYGVSIADLAKIDGTATADLAKVMGLDVVTSTKGFIVGGRNAALTITVEVDRTLFATDTTSTDGGNLPVAAYSGASIGSNTAAVYTLGGIEAGGNIDTMRKHTVATDAISTPAGVLSAARRISAGISERSTKGYIIGGYVAAASVIADKVTFATDAVAATASADKTLADFGMAGVHGSSTHGYLIGGNGGATQRQEKTTFGTDTTALVGAVAAPVDLDQSRGLSDGTSSYVVGEAGVGVNLVKTVASTDAMTDTGNNLNTVRWDGAAFSSGTVSGYFIAGRTNPVGPVTQTLTAEKFAFATETASLTAAADRPSASGLGPAGASDVGL